jgi:hypothetical protein
MKVKTTLIAITALLALLACPAIAQQSLGDILSQVGYDSMIGKWTATDDSGNTCKLEYKWILDRHAIAVNFKAGRMQYQGMIMFVPYSEQVIQIGADNNGGTLKGNWSEDYDGAAHRIEHEKADGTVEKIEHVHIMVDKDTFKVKEYAIESNGWRASQPRGELTFKREKK